MVMTMSKESDDKARALMTWKALKNASPKNKKIIKDILKEEMLVKTAGRKKTKKVKSPHN
jgi:hypothetical protein